MIEVRGLRKTYGDGPESFEALRGIDFTVRDGEFVAVMGPSGCGKSTLLAILGLLDRPSEGSYRLAGREVGALDDLERTLERRVTIGFVFQSFNLLPRISALENVALPMTYAGVARVERRERAAAMLHKVGLGKKTLRTPLQLSGGERQRVSIARALANGPRVLLADEPTGNLDSRTSAEILALFEELHADGMTTVLVTHDRAVAERSQRVLRVADGLIVEGDS
ncbi:MAG: ABC transporter ATP-binding protein [Elusimicrobiota bacterium]|jgi:putative ABC transport system ATP-binding protein